MYGLANLTKTFDDREYLAFGKKNYIYRAC